MTPATEANFLPNATEKIIDHIISSNHTTEDNDSEEFNLAKWEFIKYVWFILHWLAMSHSCYNPIIYCYMNARFRNGFLRMLLAIPGIRRCCCKDAYSRDRSASLRTGGIALTGIKTKQIEKK